MSILAIKWLIGGSFVLIGSLCVILRSMWVNRHNHEETLYRVKLAGQPAYLTSHEPQYIIYKGKKLYELRDEIESVEEVRE